MDRPIPAFYCVYLLRSPIRPSLCNDFYVGSTPHPLRRQRQHNGISKGGAKRTRNIQKRPWNMCMIISGFPSKISALQFEWAWQNTYKTRHVTPEARAFAKRMFEPQGRRKKANSDSENAKPPTKKQNSQRRLLGLMNDLNLLLTSKSFSRLPLSLRFFQSDIYHKWRTRKGSLDPTFSSSSVSFGPDVYYDDVADAAIDRSRDEIMGNSTGLEHLETSYAPFESSILRSLSHLSDKKPLFCSICTEEIHKDAQLTLICPHDPCSMASHVSCLAKHFLEQEREVSAVLPTKGACPSCEKTLKWTSLMRDLSLRIRGQGKIDKLIKAKCSEVKPVPGTGVDLELSTVSLLDDETDEDDMNDTDDMDRKLSSEMNIKDAVHEYHGDHNGFHSRSKRRGPKSFTVRAKILPDGEVDEDEDFQNLSE